MFERYTERARRVIFFARYEASSYGSTTIETGHFLLGLMREDKILANRFLAPISDSESMRARVEKHLTVAPKVSTSIDLPLSDECKRILKHAKEESERLGHRFIGTEHLLLGILCEPDCVATRVLVEAGLRLDAVREALKEAPPPREGFRFPEVDLPAADRPSIHALVDQLPENALPKVKWLMDQMMAQPTMPGPMLGFQARVMERLRRRARGEMAEGRASSSRQEDGATVVETHQLLKGHQVSTTERYSISADGKTLHYSHEVVGPRPEQQHKHAMEFDLS